MAFPQPVPPSWKDLGKSCTDLLQKEYPFHGVSLEVKTKTPSGVTFKVAGQDHKTGEIYGDIEAKYSDAKNGLNLTQTWTTTNILKSSVELENQIAKGLKFELHGTLAPEKNTHSAILNAAYKQSGIHSRVFLDVFKGPTVTADSVIGRDGFLVGVEGAYNVTDGKIHKYALAAGYNAPEYAVSFLANQNLKTFHAGYYHKVSPDVEAGAKAVYDTKATNPTTHLEVGTKVYLDAASFLKAKINSSGVVALGYTQSLRPGVKVQFGLALDTAKLNAANHVGASHKVGAHFVFES